MANETHAQIAARLVEGCLSASLGGQAVHPGTAGGRVRAEDRARLLADPANQLSADGATYFFPIGEKEGVFCDISPERTTIWFERGNVEHSLFLLEQAIKRAFPTTRIIDERDHPSMKNMRVTFYRLDLNNGVSVLVEATYPATNDAPRQFVARVIFLRKEQPPGGDRSEEAITQASLTAFLAMHTVVPMVLGRLKARTPVVGVPLTPQQRQELGLAAGGETIVYDLVGGEVIMDLAGNVATISFAHGDVDTAMSTFDRLLKRDNALFSQIEDVNHPRGGKRRLRVYEAGLENGVLCRIEADYPSSGAQAFDHRFVVRVIAFQTQVS